jgi:hypothetical protein
MLGCFFPLTYLFSISSVDLQVYGDFSGVNCGGGRTATGDKDRRRAIESGRILLPVRDRIATQWHAEMLAGADSRRIAWRISRQLDGHGKAGS